MLIAYRIWGRDKLADVHVSPFWFRNLAWDNRISAMEISDDVIESMQSALTFRDD
jgi:hypothetical protein